MQKEKFKRWNKETKSRETIKIESMKSTNNNCLIQCFNKCYGICGNTLKPDQVRKDLNLELGSLIHYDMIPKLSEYYNKKTNKNLGYLLLNQNLEDVIVGGCVDDYIQLYIRSDHYYLYSYINYKKCEDCGIHLRKDNINHKCNINNVSYRNRIVQEKNDIVKVQNIKEKEKLDYNNVVSWDLETFQETIRHEAYASGFLHNEKYTCLYGIGCMNKTVDQFLTYENKILTAYNGSGFHFYFLLDELMERGVDIHNFIINNGKLMYLEFGKNNKVFDLYLFINSSLDKACKDFQIINAKTSFDHSLMKDWEDVETYMNKVVPYLKLDVLALNELFIKLNDMMYEKFQINITKFMTLGSMGFEIWSSTLKDIIELPKDMKKYNHIMKSKYGGRTTCNQKRFTSKMYPELMKIVDERKKSGLEDNKYLFKETYNQLMQSRDYIFNADVSSLYPASMRGNALMNVNYPIGRSRWSTEPKADYENGKMGFYNVKFECPKNIRVPILPRRKLNISGTNIDGEGVYISVDIENALENGYTIDFLDDALVYDSKSSSVFVEYVDTFFKLKQEAEVEKNPVLRSIAKLLLNSLYGKMLQKAMFTINHMVNNAYEFNEFHLKHKLINWRFCKKGKLLLSGEVQDKEKKITKPAQLGCFVTAYSRKLMILFMKEIDPTLQSTVFTYSDTDSLHIKGDLHKKLLDLGYIKSKEDSILGYLTNDIDDDGIIIDEMNLAPKSYKYTYLTKDGLLKEVMKMKGIPNKSLKSEFYINELPAPVLISGLKKKK
ncbi:DNA polymerase [Clostridium sp.]|uniref:DNA polymerase n=1 Tax=Clostridium sp. TaxID=1506 RepID=UPI002845F8BC|nr:DNA polymerase [Clostridium sp.]MDR3594722.1 DNA polymerase [Clostridium sp.]